MTPLVLSNYKLTLEHLFRKSQLLYTRFLRLSTPLASKLLEPKVENSPPVEDFLISDKPTI